jgi:hypothetical protein
MTPSTATIAKTLFRSLQNERSLDSVDISIEDTTKALAFAVQEGWIDRNMELTEKGRAVATRSPAGKIRSRGGAIFAG